MEGTKLFHVPSSHGRGLPGFDHCHVCLPEAPLHLFTSSGPGAGSAVLGGTSSSEPPHLQHEEQGAQRHPEDTDSIILLSAAVSCTCLFTSDFQWTSGTSCALGILSVITKFIQECLHPHHFSRAMNPACLTQRPLYVCLALRYSWPPVSHLCDKRVFPQGRCLEVGLFFQS